jgi:hypothetical protein
MSAEQIVIDPQTSAVIVARLGDRPFWSCLLFLNVVGHGENQEPPLGLSNFHRV